MEREREMEKEGNVMEKEGNGSREKGKEMWGEEKGRGRWSKKEMVMENKREMEVEKGGKEGGERERKGNGGGEWGKNGEIKQGKRR